MNSAEQILSGKIFKSPESASVTLNDWRVSKEKIAFTNGVFDLLHIGHITYLAKAANEGTKLIIGLNSDTSVKRIKGEHRPINGQDTRAAILAAFFFVDAVIIFYDDTPLELIKSIRPDVLIKGADYAIKYIAGSADVLANGGQVKVIDFVTGHSSTNIIERIRSQK